MHSLHFPHRLKLGRHYKGTGRNQSVGRQAQASCGRQSRESPELSGTANSLNRIIRFLFWAALVNGAVWLLRRRFPDGMGRESLTSPGSPAAAAIPLYRDPMCGTHVSPEISFTLEQAGRKKHFCSAECRDRFQRSARPAASA